MSSSRGGGKNRAFWPLIGFILALSLGVLSWALGPIVIDWMDASNIVRGFPSPEVPRTTWNWIATGVMFVILLMFSSLVVALFRPKQAMDVREKDLAKEREQLRRNIKAKKELQRRINKQMKDR
ncbi:MAG: hypothetical protein HXY41_10360 [Chloroflexi bacterium]|nr:hypothetical protein [Chloroflexota bacterium]